MNIQDLHDTITSQYAHKLTQMMDSAAYAYVTQQLEYLKSKGEDLTQYEVVIVHPPNGWELTDDNYRVTQQMRVVKRKDNAGIDNAN